MTRQTKPKLVVDNFGTKVSSNDDEKHIIDTLKKLYNIKVNKKEDFYLGMKLE